MGRSLGEPVTVVIIIAVVTPSYLSFLLFSPSLRRCRAIFTQSSLLLWSMSGVFGGYTVVNFVYLFGVVQIGIQ